MSPSDGATHARAKQAPKNDTAVLRRERDRLRLELVDAAYQEEQAEINLTPFDERFQIAHNRLMQITINRRNGHVYPKKQLLKLYDERMQAGHVAHPHRQKLREAQRWKKAIRDALAAVNAEIEP